MEFAKITSGGNVSAYPVLGSAIRAAHPETSFPSDLSIADLSDFGFTQVFPTPAPVPDPGQIVVTKPTADANGVWRQQHTVKDLTGAALDERLTGAKAMLRRSVEAQAAEVFTNGYHPEDGPMAGHTLQVRDVEDRTNWLTSQAAYATAVAMGQGGVEGAKFRTVANTTITLTFAEGLGVLLGMASWGADIMANSWALKDAINTADDFAQLGKVDIQVGWPA